MSVKKITGREFTLNVLNGISMGAVVSLIPGALLGQLMQALAKIWPTFAHAVLDITTFNMSLLPAMAGFSVGYLFKMNMVQMSSIAGAAMVGSGVIVKTQQGFGLAGTGDVINVGVTIVFSVLLAWLIGNKFKNYTILLLPIIVIVIGGSLGLLVLPYVKAVTALIGAGIKTFTLLQPILMGVLMGISCIVAYIDNAHIDNWYARYYATGTPITKQDDVFWYDEYRVMEYRDGALCSWLSYVFWDSPEHYEEAKHNSEWNFLGLQNDTHLMTCRIYSFDENLEPYYRKDFQVMNYDDMLAELQNNGYKIIQ